MIRWEGGTLHVFQGDNSPMKDYRTDKMELLKPLLVEVKWTVGR